MGDVVELNTGSPKLIAFLEELEQVVTKHMTEITVAEMVGAIEIVKYEYITTQCFIDE